METIPRLDGEIEVANRGDTTEAFGQAFNLYQAH